MTMEQAAFGVAGLCIAILLTMIGYTGDRMQKSVDDLRNMLDDKLSDLTTAIRVIENDLREQLSSHDRRITIMEEYQDRRKSDDESNQAKRRDTNGKH